MAMSGSGDSTSASLHSSVSRPLTEVADGLSLWTDLYGRLYEYQQDALRWFWKLHSSGAPGGILGDDMGLGKTLQTTTFLHSLFVSRKIRFALVVCPKSLIPLWTTELSKWIPFVEMAVFHGDKGARLSALKDLRRRGGLCLTTYGTLHRSVRQLLPRDSPLLDGVPDAAGGGDAGRDSSWVPITWDYVVCDEGHKVKNPHSMLFKIMRHLPCHHRLVLTGTPMQNRLEELWSLMDFIHQGQLLGDLAVFKRLYAAPITRSRARDGSQEERLRGQALLESLWCIVSPYILRREKSVILAARPSLGSAGAPAADELNEAARADAGAVADPGAGAGAGAVVPAAEESVSFSRPAALTRKTDLILWIPLTEKQRTLYQEFLDGRVVQRSLSEEMYPLAALSFMKKICDHPALLVSQRQMSRGLALPQSADDLGDDTACKMIVLQQLVVQLRSENHRMLVFAQSRLVLNRIHRMMKREGFKLCRIDGTMHRVADRQARVNAFNSDTSFHAFLLTTQVGGLGLTLTGADRVIIYDPAWNPAVDNQAVDRIYRIGQTRDVVVYRLVTCNTVEEKMYRKQVFKTTLIRATLQQQNPLRYFTQAELRDFFTLEAPLVSDTQLLLELLGDAVAARYRAGPERLPQKEVEDRQKRIVEMVLTDSADAVQHGMTSTTVSSRLAPHLAALLQMQGVFGLSDNSFVGDRQQVAQEAEVDVVQMARDTAAELLVSSIGRQPTLDRGPRKRRPPSSVPSVLDDFVSNGLVSLEQMGYALAVADQLDQLAENGTAAEQCEDDGEQQQPDESCPPDNPVGVTGSPMREPEPQSPVRPAEVKSFPVPSPGPAAAGAPPVVKLSPERGSTPDEQRRLSGSKRAAPEVVHIVDSDSDGSADSDRQRRARTQIRQSFAALGRLSEVAATAADGVKQEAGQETGAQAAAGAGAVEAGNDTSDVFEDARSHFSALDDELFDDSVQNEMQWDGGVAAGALADPVRPPSPSRGAAADDAARGPGIPQPPSDTTRRRPLSLPAPLGPGEPELLQVCRQHRQLRVPAEYVRGDEALFLECTRCSCCVSETERQTYMQLVTADPGDASDGTLQLLLQAFALCNEDVRLHLRLLQVATQLQLLVSPAAQTVLDHAVTQPR